MDASSWNTSSFADFQRVMCMKVACVLNIGSLDDKCERSWKHTSSHAHAITRSLVFVKSNEIKTPEDKDAWSHFCHFLYIMKGLHSKESSPPYLALEKNVSCMQNFRTSWHAFADRNQVHKAGECIRVCKLVLEPKQVRRNAWCRYMAFNSNTIAKGTQNNKDNYTTDVYSPPFVSTENYKEILMFAWKFLCIHNTHAHINTHIQP